MLPDLVCLSHLRWNFVFQRPQHLMTRFAAERRVFYFEEPIFDGDPRLEVTSPLRGLTVVVPHLRAGSPGEVVGSSARSSLVLRSYDVDRQCLVTTPPWPCRSRGGSMRSGRYDHGWPGSRCAARALSLESELLTSRRRGLTGGRTLY